MRKRMTSLLLTLVMLLSLVPAMGVTASAAEPEWTTVYSYAELQTAVKAKKEYIQLGRNIDTKDFHYSGGGLDIADWLTFEGQTCTLDLNGKTLSLLTKMKNMPTFMRVYKGSNLTIKDSQGGGQITGKFENTGASDSYLIHMNQSSLTLEGGTFRATAEPYGTNVNVIDYLESNVTIKDGVTISQPEHYAYGGGGSSELQGHGYALCEHQREFNYGDEVSHVVIDGGIFDGWVRLIGYPDTNGSVQINGGTFKKGVQVLYIEKKNNSAPAVAVNDGTFEGTVYLKYWDWKESLYMPYRLNGGTFKGTVDLHAAYSITAYDKPEGNPNIPLGLNECFGYSAVVTPDGIFTGTNIKNAVLSGEVNDYFNAIYYKMLLQGSESNPVRIIPNAWGIDTVTLDGNVIDYAKDWKGAAVEITNDTAHTLTFTWNRLAQELIDAGYSYDAKCEHYISGSSAVQQTDTIAAGATSHTVTIPAGADPKVYSFDLHLNLEKNDSFVGIMSNEHIVKLVVNQAAPVTPTPTVEGNVYYTSGIVFGRPISIAPSGIPDDAVKAYQWQRSTDGGSTWADIDGATRGSYTPGKDDMGANVRIRVVVTAKGYLGEIVGAPLTVSKAANDDPPAWPNVVAQKDGSDAYTEFEITNYNPEQEYVYTKSPVTGSEWPDGGTEIHSSTVKELNTGSTYYIYTRYEETATHTAGSKIRSSSVLVDEITKLNKIILTDESSDKVYSSYGSGNTIYIKKGESVTLTATTNPVGANTWSDFTFKSQYGFAAPFTVTPTESVASGAEIPSVTIYGKEAGTGTLAAEYPSHPLAQSYGTWRVHVYEDVSDIGTDAEITVSSSFPDMTMYQGETMPLPDGYTVDVYPEGALENYDLEWRIVKVGEYGASYKTSDDNITLENDEIKATKKHTGSENTRIALVAINKDNNYYISSLSDFYVTVTEAPVIELTGVTVAPTRVNLDIGKKITLSAAKQPANAEGTLEWTSDKPEIATVSSTGMVTAKAQGTAIITVTCGTEPDTKSASCTVLVDHTHSYEGQPYLYLDPGNHYQECTAGDGYNIQPHAFTAWTDNRNGTHSRHCTVCKMTDSSTYTETAEHTWVWVVDQEAALNQPGKQHEECVDCPAKRSENTEIPALRDYAVTVTGGTATVAAGTITRAMEGVEVTVTAKAPAGKHFVKWVVKAGGVTLANETSATTTFIMPAMDVEIEANFEKNASTGTGTGATTYPITVKSAKNGDVTASHKSASKGTTVTLTVDPDKGYVLDTLTVLDGKDKELKLTEKNGKYTFTMPDSKVTVEAMFKASAPTGKNPFIDVPVGSYYEDAVVWAVGKNITTGMSAAAFDPNGSCTRAQIVTFLWRAAGSPEPKTMKGFDDVASNAYYAKAVAWAVENGITTGTSASKFSPNDPCTRTQAVTFLFRYAAANGMEAVTMQELLSGYADAASVPSYAVSAMNWALAAGILQGDGVKLMPNATCTRAQIVTFLYRAMK